MNEEKAVKKGYEFNTSERSYHIEKSKMMKYACLVKYLVMKR